MAAPLKLISHKLCPYVQRAVIALNEKGVAFERIDIDLANKPDWFLKISPLGKVPVLTVASDKRRGGAVREQRHLRIHRGDPGRRKTASAGSAAARPAPGMDGVRLGHSERSMGSRNHHRCRDLREQARGGCGEVRACRGGAGRGPVLRGREASAWWTRCLRRSFAISTCSTSSSISRCSRRRRRCGSGERSLRSGPVFRPRSGPIIRELLRAFLVRHDAHLLKLAA